MRDRVQARADSLGLGVKILRDGVCLQDVHPPLNVVDAFRDVSIATKERERLKNEGDRYRRQQLISAAGRNAWHELSSIQRELDDEQWAALWRKLSPQLAGEAAGKMNAARAFADEQEQLAAGEAVHFALQEAVHAENPHLTQWRLYVDALARALAGKKKLILDRSAAGRRHLMLGLPSASTLPMLIPNSQEHE
jgi:regulator of protease activity HflC (stomatin/prohibitin superfamily)